MSDKTIRIERINPRQETGDKTAPTKLYQIWVGDKLVDSAPTKAWAIILARLARRYTLART